jgi:hypothetical protein
MIDWAEQAGFPDRSQSAGLALATNCTEIRVKVVIPIAVFRGA